VIEEDEVPSRFAYSLHFFDNFDGFGNTRNEVCGEDTIEAVVRKLKMRCVHLDQLDTVLELFALESLFCLCQLKAP